MKFKILPVILFVVFIFSCFQERVLTRKLTHNNDRMLIINGKRTFIIGSYHLPAVENPHQALADAGFNTIRTSASIEALDQAHQAGLYAWIQVDTIDQTHPTESSRQVGELIKKGKDHPALLFWETIEAPAEGWENGKCKVSPATLKATYDFIKTIDAEHWVFTNHAPTHLSTTLEKYNSGNDFVACHIFPVTRPCLAPIKGLRADGLHGDLINPYISQIGSYTDKMQNVTAEKRPLMMVLQAFAWEMLPEENNRDSLVRYPTRHETRFMAYQAIIHGANGIIYWGLCYTPAASPFWQDLKQVVSELASIRDILSAPTKYMHLVEIYHEMGHSVDLGVEIIIKKANGIYYLIAANADKTPAKVSISGFGREELAEVLFENRTIQIVNRELTDTFEPFDVHVYKLRDQ